MVDMPDEVYQKMSKEECNLIPISAFQKGDEVLIKDAKSGLREIWTVTKRNLYCIEAQLTKSNGETKVDQFWSDDVICKMDGNQLLFSFM